MRLLLCLGLLLLTLPLFAFEKTGSYKTQRIEGFKVLLSAKLREHPKERDAAIEELQHQLQSIKKAVPRNAWFRLQHVPIWMEWNSKPNGAAEYHPSALWLRRNGYNPSKAGAVEINNVVNFVKWSKDAQPWMVLHELAHAWHHKVAKHENRDILVAFKSASESGSYEKVKHIKGRTVRAYALTNDKEYFAEVTEAYFGKNDMFPFNRDELRKHDPKGFAAAEKTWKLK